MQKNRKIENPKSLLIFVKIKIISFFFWKLVGIIEEFLGYVMRITVNNKAYEGIHFPCHMGKKCREGLWKTLTGRWVHCVPFPVLLGRQDRGNEKDYPGYSKGIKSNVLSTIHRSGLRESCVVSYLTKNGNTVRN